MIFIQIDLKKKLFNIKSPLHKRHFKVRSFVQHSLCYPLLRQSQRKNSGSYSAMTSGAPCYAPSPYSHTRSSYSLGQVSLAILKRFYFLSSQTLINRKHLSSTGWFSPILATHQRHVQNYINY
jgi:hypothetical protein